jgi:copper chaperone NosL
MPKKIRSLFCLGLILIFIPFTCLIAQEERIIHVRYDSSRCDYCRMLFQERKFGGELQTANDSILVFDASECQAAFLIAGKIPETQVKNIWSVNYLAPGVLVDAHKAWYLRCDRIMSPMEANIAAFNSKQEADSVRSALGGDILTWEGVISLIRNRWFPKK